jgi:hypothetical protein
MPRRTALVLLLALLAGTLTAGIAHQGISRFSSDSFHYMLLGDALAHGRGFASGGSQHPDLTRAPLLPLMIAPLIWVLGDPVRAGIAAITLCAAALALPLFFLCRNLFGPRAGYAALPLASLSCVVGTADRVLPTGLHLLGLMATAALMVRSLKRGRPFDAFWVGVAGGLTALARPEGLPFLALPVGWTLLGPWPFAEGLPPARPLRTRLAVAAWIVAGAALCYGPYAGWASARLHRLALLPSLQYVNDTRYVSDRFGLRGMTPFIPWEERALFLLTADGQERVLDLYFHTRRMPDARTSQTLPQAATAGPENPARTRNLVARRIQIARRNLRLVPSHLRGGAHLLPPLPLLLGLVGVIACLTRRGGWRPLLFTAALMGFGLLPVVTNLEDRFLYAPFAAGLVVAAAGWGEIDRRTSTRLPATARIALHAALLCGIAASGMTHRMTESPKLDLELAQRTLAARAQPSLPPGPILAVRPHFPFWAGRAYGPLPILGPEEVLAFARKHGVQALILQVPYDVKNRPQLAALAQAIPPPGFTRIDRQPIAGGGELLLFRLGLSGRGTLGGAP